MKNHKILLFVLCLICTLPLHAQSYYEVKSKILDVLERPDLNAQVIGQLKEHDIVEVHATSGGWATIKYQERTAYVEEEGISFLYSEEKRPTEQPTAAPVVPQTVTQPTAITSSKKLMEANTPTIMSKNKTIDYKGYVDFDCGGSVYYDDIYFGFLTSHGILIKDRLYIGAGLGYNYHGGDDTHCSTLPCFVNTRFNFLKKRVSPFFDCKVGGSFLGGIYLSTSVGTRIKLKKKVGLNFSIAYTLQSHEVKINDFYGYFYYSSYHFEDVNVHHIGIRLGIDF